AESASATGINATARLPPRIRHCERSEAIQSLVATLDCFVALFLAMTASCLNPERRERLCHVVGRGHVNHGEAARAGAFDILGEIVEEYDPRSRHPDRFHHMIIGGGIRFPKPDRGRYEDFTEM